MYTISVLLPAAYLIGLIFTLKTHSHIYDIHISDAHGHGVYLWFCFWIMTFWLNDVLFNVLIALFVLVVSDHSAVVHWSRTRALVVLILATVLMAACADLSTEHIKPIISNSYVSQVHFT